MFAIFVIGFAILAILSGTFSYVLNIFELFVISGLSFLVYYFILGKRNVLIWSILATILAITVTSYYLYKKELLESTGIQIANFVKPYYYSMRIQGFYIGRFHQQLLILACCWRFTDSWSLYCGSIFIDTRSASLLSICNRYIHLLL
ncbi:MAG: hypothetical protein CVU95_07645 [Firmicutes bacterium HGW-Firmicutes-2]|nr:MAG: hypothetical protein CVU95_07645 [Firmicutes bacterium HGW-Firmicutes-2]